jgi:hypothetical protein
MSNSEVIEVAEKLYREANPDSKMDVPSFAYEMVDRANKRRLLANRLDMSLYDYCKMELSNSKNSK